MKVTVVGGTGFIGTRIVAAFREPASEVVVASPKTGVDAMTGEGLDAAMSGTDVVVDVTNAPSFDEGDIRTFFETATENISAAAVQNGVKHYLLLSIVGVDRMADSPYMRGKLLQEQIISTSGVPFTILRATQFFEFLATFADIFLDNGTIRLPAVLNRAVAADDVATTVVRLTGEKANGQIIDLAGPEVFRLIDMVRQILAARNDRRSVLESSEAQYFGARLNQDAMIPHGPCLTGTQTFSEWLDEFGNGRQERRP